MYRLVHEIKYMKRERGNLSLEADEEALRARTICWSNCRPCSNRWTTLNS
jgi:hypothetical protein